MIEVRPFVISELVKATLDSGQKILSLVLPLKAMENDRLRARNTLMERVTMMKGGGDRVWHEEDGKLYVVRVDRGLAEWVDNICDVPTNETTSIFAVGDWGKFVDQNNKIRVGEIEKIGLVEGKEGVRATLRIPGFKNIRRVLLSELKTVTAAEVPLEAPEKKEVTEDVDA